MRAILVPQDTRRLSPLLMYGITHTGLISPLPISPALLTLHLYFRMRQQSVSKLSPTKSLPLSAKFPVSAGAYICPINGADAVTHTIAQSQGYVISFAPLEIPLVRDEMMPFIRRRPAASWTKTMVRMGM